MVVESEQQGGGGMRSSWFLTVQQTINNIMCVGAWTDFMHLQPISQHCLYHHCSPPSLSAWLRQPTSSTVIDVTWSPIKEPAHIEELMPVDLEATQGFVGHNLFIYLMYWLFSPLCRAIHRELNTWPCQMSLPSFEECGADVWMISKDWEERKIRWDQLCIHHL